jgi:hypothetical protein
MSKTNKEAVKSLLENVAYWRNRAEETRIRAETIADPKARKTMLEIAETYDGLAERADKRLKRIRKP